MKAFIRLLRDFALMMTRIVMGVVMVTHGWHRWQNEGVSAEADILAMLGLPNPPLLVWLIIGFEVIGGILLVFGLATPLIGFGIIVLNLGIIAMLRADTFYVHDSGWEYNAMMAVVGLILLAFGSGRAGLDNLFLQPKEPANDRLIEDAPAAP